MNAQIVDIEDPRVVKALAHPIRMKILNILEEGTATPKELAATLGLPLENVSYHVRTLKDFGFIKLERTRQVRGAVEHHYKLAARPRIGDRLWQEVPRVVQEAMVDAQLKALVDTVGQAAHQGGFDRGDAHISRYSLVLDEAGLKEVGAILLKALSRAEEVSQKAQKRIGDGEGMRISAAALLFETPSALPGEDGAAARDGKRRKRAPAAT